MAFHAHTLLTLCLVFVAQVCVVMALLTNVTVDDTLGDFSTGQQVSYTPSDGWSPGQNCSTCTAHPDPDQMLFNTWHDASFFPDVDDSQDLTFTASITFNGVAVYVFCAIDHASDNPDGNSDMTFFIDGEEVGTFELAPNGEDTFSYNVPVYVNESLPSGQHTLTMMNGRLGGSLALALLDYFIYTQDIASPPSVAPSSTSGPTSSITSLTASSTSSSSTTTTSSSSSAPQPSISGSSSDVANAQKSGLSDTAKIAIGVGAGVGVMLVLIATLILYWCRRRRRASSGSSFAVSVIPARPRPTELESSSVTSGWVEGTWADAEETTLHPSLLSSRTADGSAAGSRGRGRGHSTASSSSSTKRPLLNDNGTPLAVSVGGVPTRSQVPTGAGGNGPATSGPATPVLSVKVVTPSDRYTHVSPATSASTTRTGASRSSRKAPPIADTAGPNRSRSQGRSKSTRRARRPQEITTTIVPAEASESADTSFLSLTPRAFEGGVLATVTSAFPDPSLPSSDSVRLPLRMQMPVPMPVSVPTSPSEISASPLTLLSSVMSPLHHSPSSAYSRSAGAPAPQHSVSLPSMKIDLAESSGHQDEDFDVQWGSPPPSYVESPH